MNPKVFRLSPFRKWLFLLVGLAVIGLLIQIMGLVIGPYPFKQNPLQGFMAVPVILILLLILLLAYIIWMIWSYSIEFSETELRVGRYGNPIARRVHCLYSDIKHVRRGTYRMWIEIVPLNGKSFIIMTIVKRGSDGLIDELEKHIPAEKFQPSLRKEMKRFSMADWARWGFPVFIWLFMLLQWSPRMILPHIAWTTEWGTGFLPSGHVNNYWIENDGTAWVSVMDSGTTAQVIRISGDEKRSWKLENDKDVLYADAVVAGGDKQPWLIHSDKLLHWVNSSWQTSFLDEYTVRADPSVIIDNDFWAIGSRENEFSQYLLELDLSSGQTAWFSIPEERKQDNFSIQEIVPAPDNSIVVLLAKKKSPQAYFYSFQNGEWTPLCSVVVEWYISEFGNDNTDENAYIQLDDFTVDRAGNIWVINDKEGQSSIGRYDNLKNTWDWSQMAPDCELCLTNYSAIVVDGFGRVWLAAGYSRKNNVNDTYSMAQGWGVDVFTPQWNQSAEHLARYTNKNSNYQVGFGSTGIRLSSDGRIWAARDHLVWIDSNDPNLPGTMPSWFVEVTDPEHLMIGYLVGLVLMAILYLGMWIVGLIQKRKNRLKQNDS